MVVDLSSLWAGPLVGHLLLRAGARVVKVESTTRPDGARRGSHASSVTSTGARSPWPSTSPRPPDADSSTAWWPGPTWSSPGPGPGPSTSWASTSRTGSAAGRPASGCPSPATGRRAHRAVGWPSGTTPRWPGDWWPGTARARASAATPSPTRPPAWPWPSPHSPPSPREGPGPSTPPWPTSPADCAAARVLPVVGLPADPPPDPGDGSAPEVRGLGADTEAVLASLARG